MTTQFTRTVAAAAAVASLVLLAGTADAAAKRDEKVYQAVETDRASALALLKSIVNIDSGSGDIKGGEQVEALLAERLNAAGAEVRSVPAEDSTVAPNLVAVFHGT